MKIVIAPDSFKGSLSAVEASKSIERGVKKVFPHAEIVLKPMGDGGEGTMDTLVAVTGGRKKTVWVTDPLGQKVEAEYGVLGDDKTCVIEMASASGLSLIPKEKLNPLKTTTYGTGELLKQALNDGYYSFILAIGGSATNDGGAGMLQALGMKILDAENKQIGFGGEELDKVQSLDMSDFDSRIKASEFIIASDVQNPLIGQLGASHVFGPQKGASSEDVLLLDSCMTNWANIVEKHTGVHLHNLPGAGAAGGIGGAFQAFFPSETRRGIDIVIEYSKLNEALLGADLVITGEGQVDFQTASGKVPMGVAQAAKSNNVSTVVIAGSIGKGIKELYRFGIVSVNSILNKPMTLNQAFERASELVEESSEQIVRTFFHKQINLKKEVLQYEN
ncbi:glycerate kinase [Fictibacillus sp. BK138]|uniref:glycerate kinase n=1 Tax=Fictibacillus sp. BK138 TaxID=2512121 RepID=UPI001029AD25|nr:glycerate kinase [Fictibacillus sp. BK138]RZT21433.1 glycerate kinase [Fictibacillus sp. BK138]